MILRYCLVIAILLLLPLLTFAQDELLPLEDDEGYLVVGIDITGIYWTSFVINRDRKLVAAHRVRTKDLQTEPMYKIIKLPAGQYRWGNLELLNSTWFEFDKDQFPMSVEAGRINYGGVFVGRQRTNEVANFSVLNRATSIIDHLENCCSDLLEKYPLRSGLTDADPFLKYYSSLNRDADKPSVLSSASDRKSYDSGIEAEVARDFFRQDQYSEPELSPDGKLIVLFEVIDDKPHIMLLDPVSQFKHSIISEGNSVGSGTLDLLGVDWIDNDDLLIQYKIFNRDHLAHVKIDFADGRPVDASVKVLGSDWYLVDPLLQQEDKAAVAVFKEGSPNLHIININLDSSQVLGLRNRKLQNKISSTFNWLLNSRGEVRAAVGLDEKKRTKTLWYRTSDSNRWHAIWTGDPEVIILPVLAWDDDETLTVISNEHSENTILTTYNRKSKTYGKTLFQMDGSDIESVLTNPSKTQVVRVSTTEDGLIRHHYLEDAKSRFPQLLDFDTFGSEPYIIDLSNNGQRAIVQTSTNDDPGAFYMLDLSEKLAYKFGDLRSWLWKYRLGATRVLSTTSSDGLAIQSFLTLPDTEVYPKPPLIVMPHGGPISIQDRQHFNGEVQMLATLGYAVLQTNYRGSGGYGKSFEEKGERQWGRLIEDDIEAALDSVLELELINADKVCIYGASYGGYSALISAIRSPERYKCAASFAGVTDMALLFHSFEVIHSNLIREEIERIVGDPKRELDSMIRYSPVFNADKIEVPVLIVHGEKDTVVDIEHYARMIMMLNYFSKDFAYFSIPNEAHGLTYLASAVSFYTRLDQFFRRSMDLPPPSGTKIARDGID